MVALIIETYEGGDKDQYMTDKEEDRMGKIDNIILRIKECRADCNYGKGKHTKAADRKNKYNHLIGVPSIAISLIIGTSILVTIKTDFPQCGKWIGAMAAYLVAVLSGVQTYFGFPSVVEGHRQSACKFRNLGKRCSNIIACYEVGSISDEELCQVLNDITEEYAEIATYAEAYPTNKKDYLQTRDEINAGGEQYTQKELETEG